MDIEPMELMHFLILGRHPCSDLLLNFIILQGDCKMFCFCFLFLVNKNCHPSIYNRHLYFHKNICPHVNLKFFNLTNNKYYFVGVAYRIRIFFFFFEFQFLFFIFISSAQLVKNILWFEQYCLPSINQSMDTLIFT